MSKRADRKAAKQAIKDLAQRVAAMNYRLDAARVRQTGEWWCVRCESTWETANPAPPDYWAFEEGPHVCPDCGSYSHTLPGAPKPGIDEFDWVYGTHGVVGESHYKKALKKALGPSKNGHSRRKAAIAHIVPEPDNKHDKHAVRVDIDGKTVGYMPRGSMRLSPKQMLVVAAVIGAGAGRKDPIGVKVEIDWGGD